MNFIYGTLSLSAPLLLASYGALISEYAGCMALFLDGIINLSAFLCFAYTVLTGSAVSGIFLAAMTGMLFITAAGIATEKLHANAFLAAIALNLLCSALTSILSVRYFGTRGVLTSPSFTFNASHMRLMTTAASLLITAAGIAALYLTRQGLYIRITGSDPDVLEAKGINTSVLRTAAWSTAALAGAVTGCIFSLRLSSFVPNVSSGTGWTALAAVFLGKKNTAAVTAAVFVFSAAQFTASNIQNVSSLKAVPPSLLLALPYLTALLLIVFSPRHQ